MENDPSSNWATAESVAIAMSVGQMARSGLCLRTDINTDGANWRVAMRYRAELTWVDNANELATAKTQPTPTKAQEARAHGGVVTRKTVLHPIFMAQDGVFLNQAEV